MFPSCNKSLYTFIVALFSVINGHSQYYNTEIEAKIVIEDNNEFIKISGTAFNKTEISQSLRYVLSVIRTGSDENNVSKNDQSGRFVLAPIEKQSLSTTTINSNETDRIIILLLVYDLDDNIKGKDRIVFNDDENSIEEQQEIANKQAESIATSASVDVDNSNKDGIVLRGIVIEDTKTKPGRDFYSMFYSSYNLNQINSDKVVVIKELLALGTNTKIEIIVDDRTIFEFFARPNTDYLKSMTDVSIRRLSYYLQSLKRQKEIVKRY